jgi:hypothetical protein
VRSATIAKQFSATSVLERSAAPIVSKNLSQLRSFCIGMLLLFAFLRHNSSDNGFYNSSSFLPKGLITSCMMGQ